MKVNSAKLVHQRRRRTLFICGVIVSMCMLSAIGLILCPTDSYNGNSESSNFANFSTQISESDSTVFVSQTFQRNMTIRTPTSGVASAISLVSVVNESITNASDEIVRNTLANVLTSLESFEQSHRPHGLSRYSRSPADSSIENEKGCVHQEYIVFTWVLCLVSLATALKLYYLVKAIMALGMVAFYSSFIFLRFPIEESFSLMNLKERGMPLGVQMIILLITFLIMVCYHARLVEVSRLPFIKKPLLHQLFS